MAPLAQSILLLSCAVAAHGCHSVEARLTAREAAEAYRNGDFAGSAALYAQAVQLAPGLAALELNRGFALLALARDKPRDPTSSAWQADAAGAFDRYRQLRPADPRGRTFLLETLVEAKAYDLARRYLAPDLDADPPRRDALGAIAQIAAKLGRLDDALAWNQRRASTTPPDPDAYQAIGALIWEHLHGHPGPPGDQRLALADRGIAALTRASELRPEAAEPLTFLSLLYRERAAAHACPEGGGSGARAGAGQTEDGVCADARRADLERADDYRKLAQEKASGRSKPREQ